MLASLKWEKSNVWTSSLAVIECVDLAIFLIYVFFRAMQKSE